jgi:hypothetical protein
MLKGERALKERIQNYGDKNLMGNPLRTLKVKESASHQRNYL